MQNLKRMIDSQIVNGAKYYGIIDWYVSNFNKGTGQGSIYIEVSTLYSTSFHKTFRVVEKDIELGNDLLNDKCIDFESGDVVEFVASIDAATGYHAKHVRFFGLRKHLGVKAKIHEQDWNFRLGKASGQTVQKEKSVLKLVTRPRGNNE